MSTNVLQRNFGLDVIRSVAIIMVVFGHFLTIPFNVLKISIVDSTFNNYTFFYRLFMYILGVYGVELFFVLSGFLIGKILIRIFNNGFSLSNIITFYIRRWLRTLPTYYLFLLIYIFVFIIFPLKIDFFSALVSKFSYFFFLQSFNTKAIDFYAISWSLSIEEWFYFFCPLVLAALYIAKIKPENLYKSIIQIIIFIAIARFFFILSGHYSFLEVRCSIPLRFDALLIGVLFSCLKINNETIYNKLLNKKIIILNFIVLIFIISYFSYFCITTNSFDVNSLFFKTHFWSILPICFGILIIFFEKNEFINKKVSSFFIIRNLFEKTSLYSYSMYLSHSLVIILFIPILKKYMSPTCLFPFFPTLLCFSSVYVLSAILYKYYEKPLMDLRNKF